MEAIASRRRNQPAPPRVLFEDLCDPHRQPVRLWLHLLDDEVEPVVLDAHSYDRVVGSSLWLKRPDARLQFDLVDGRGGTDLRWTLFVDEPLPEPTVVKHMCHRIGELINANRRYTYGQ